MEWSQGDVERYVAEHDLPVNPLRYQGYASIGCAPCTLPGTGREGRWAGTDKLECGLHMAGPPGVRGVPDAPGVRGVPDAVAISGRR